MSLLIGVAAHRTVIHALLRSGTFPGGPSTRSARYTPFYGDCGRPETRRSC
jgi:hypothetical protein